MDQRFLKWKLDPDHHADGIEPEKVQESVSSVFS
jgi:hypothetical protein